jgi:hypothetical protein
MTATIISISKGNTKMGDVPSFSLPAGHVAEGGSCWNASTCAGKFNPLTGKGGCYAQKHPFLFPEVKAAYKRNFDAVTSDPDNAKAQLVEYMSKKKRLTRFRFDVSGDTITKEYRDIQIDIARQFTTVKFVKYTKVYGFYIGHDIPKNLSVLFSWFVDNSRDQETQLKRFVRQSYGFPMAITSIDAIETFKRLRAIGRKPALCPSQTMGKDVINCDRCNLCFDANAKGIDIVFQHHAKASDEENFKARYHGEFKQLRMV